MKTFQKLIIASAIVAICAIPSVLSLKCFICNSYNDGKECGHGNDVSSNLVKDCSEQSHEDGQHGIEYKTCRKIITWIDFDVNNNTATERIVRKCGYIESKYDNTCYYRGGFGGRQQVCSCTTDSCNSGFSFHANHLLMGAGVFLLLAIGSQH